jgi:hypothetical protein
MCPWLLFLTPSHHIQPPQIQDEASGVSPATPHSEEEMSRSEVSANTALKYLN